MKFRYLLLAILAVCTLQVSAKKKSAKEEVKADKLLTSRDSASYSLGVILGTQFSNGIEEADLNIDLFSEAFSATLAGNPTILDVNTASSCYQQYMMIIEQKAIEAQKSQSEAFFAENGKRPGVITTESGLQYEIVRMGNGEIPVATNEVRVHYEGTTLDGEKFDSSYDRGEPTTFACNRLIKGFTEGLLLMPVGSKFTFYIPYDLAYGERGAGKMIRPYASLIFTVELIEITK